MNDLNPISKERFEIEATSLSAHFEQKTKEASDITRQISFFILGLCGILILQEKQSLNNKYLLFSVVFGFSTLIFDLLQCLYNAYFINRLLKDVREKGISENELIKRRKRINKTSRYLYALKFPLIISSFVFILIYILSFE